MIKKITVCVALLVLNCMMVRSQALQWIYKGQPMNKDAEITITDYDPVMGQMLLEMDIRNTGQKDLEVVVSKEEKSMAAGAAIQLCVGVNCYPPSASKSDAFKLAAGETNRSFHVNYVIENEKMFGASTTVFTVYSGRDSASVKVHFNYSSPTANEPMEAGSYQVWQADQRIGIKGGVLLPAQVQVTGLSGRIVYTRTLHDDAVLYTDVLNKGIYIVSFLRNGKLKESKKIIVR